MMKKLLTIILIMMFVCLNNASAQDNDILVADFEGKDYGNWIVTGEAFGPGPARGTLKNQMVVTGFKGKGLVNTFYQGDKTTGTLTSPPFIINVNTLTS